MEVLWRGADQPVDVHDELTQERTVEGKRLALPDDVAVPADDAADRAGQGQCRQVPQRVGKVQVNDVEAMLGVQPARRERQRRRDRDARDVSVAGHGDRAIAVIDVLVAPRRVRRHEVDDLDLAGGDQAARQCLHVALDAAQRVELAEVEDFHAQASTER
jgi:hypothetical protein